MARTLSDTIIVAMIEASTRLASGRGPISGGSTPPGGGESAASGPAVQTAQAGTPGQSTGATTTTTDGTSKGEAGGRGASEHDTRSAAQIAADFKTIYAQMEELVRTSAEQETKAVGFGIRG